MALERLAVQILSSDLVRWEAWWNKQTPR
jgi:hypothetical protein